MRGRRMSPRSLNSNLFKIALCITGIALSGLMICGGEANAEPPHKERRAHKADSEQFEPQTNANTTPIKAELVKCVRLTEGSLRATL